MANALPMGDSGVRPSSSRSNASWWRITVKIAAWVEVVVGVSFILAIDAQSQLVFGIAPEGVGAVWGRLAGLGLLGLGIACLPAREGTARSLLIYNIIATIFFVWVGLASSFQGVVLWLVVILHAVLSLVLAFSLSYENHKTD